MIQGFIFDNDGVIIDTEEQLVLFNAVVSNELGFTFDPGLRVHFIGKPNQEGIVELLKVHGQEGRVTVEDFARRRENLMQEWYTSPCFTPGFLDYFNGLLEAFPAVNVAVASGTDEDYFNLEDQVLGVGRLFQGNVALSKRDVLHHKPAPDIFLYAADLIGISSRKCAVWEDSPLGIAAAYRAGIPKIIGYTRTLGSHLKAAAEEVLGQELRDRKGLRDGHDILLVDAFDQKTARDITIDYLRE